MMAGHGLLDRIVMAVELVANGCPDKVRTIGIEPLLDEEVDMTKVDVTEVDGDLFAIARLWSKLAHVVRQCSFVHLYTICADGIWALTNLVASPRCQLLPRAGRGRQQGFHTGLHRLATASGQRNHRAGIMNYSPAGSPATGDGHL